MTGILYLSDSEKISMIENDLLGLISMAESRQQ